jgi:hypothetical protein
MSPPAPRPFQNQQSQGQGAGLQQGDVNMNNSPPPNNFNNSNSVDTTAAAANPASPSRGGFLQVKVKTGAPVNEAVNFPFMGRGRDAQQQLHQQQLQHQQPLTHNIMPRSSSHPMMMNIDVHNSTANEPMAISNQMWMYPPMGDVDVGNNEPLPFNVENSPPSAADGIQMFEDMLFNVNEGNRTKRGWVNQRSYSEPTLSILADVFNTIDASDFNENIHLGLESTPTVDGWASPPPPPVFDKVAPSYNDRNGNGGGMQQHPSRKRSSSEPFVITDILNELQEFEPQNMFDGRLAGGSSNGASRTFRSATAPPEWGEFEEEINRKAKRGNSFTLGQVMLNGQHEFDDNFLFGQTPSTSATTFLTSSATSSSAHQPGSNTPALNDFTLALCAVQETQTNLRTLQPLIMQLGNLAAIEEISIASKLTASSSQFILTSDLPNVYACLNDAWERIMKLEDLLSMSAASATYQEESQQQSQGHNNLSELQMMLTHGSGVPSPGGGMANYPSPMVTPTQPPLPPFQPNPVVNHCAPIPPTYGAFAQFALAATNKNDPVRNANSTSESGMPSTLENVPILVKTMTPLPKANISPCNTTALATSATPSLTSIPSIGKNDGDLKDLPPPSNTDPDIIMKRLQALMERTQMSQKRLQVSTM